MNLEEKYRNVRNFLAASPAERQRRIEVEYRERAPCRDTDDNEQIVWHTEMLEEQLSHLGGLLFGEPPPDYSIEVFISSIEFTATRLCVEFVDPIASYITDERFRALWKVFVPLTKAVREAKQRSETAVRAFRLMYLCAYAMGVTLNIKAVLQKQLTNGEIAAVLSANSHLVSENGDLDVQTLSQLLDNAQAETTRPLSRASQGCGTPGRRPGSRCARFRCRRPARPTSSVSRNGVGCRLRAAPRRSGPRPKSNRAQPRPGFATCPATVRSADSAVQRARPAPTPL